MSRGERVTNTKALSLLTAATLLLPGLALAAEAKKDIEPAAAPASPDDRPKTAGAGGMTWDKLPDWSGIWNNSAQYEEGKFSPFDRATADPPDAGLFKPGERTHPPYKPEWEAKYKNILDAAVHGKSFDPQTHCLAPGFPRIMAEPFNAEFIVTPTQSRLIWESFNTIRRVYTDGRGFLPEEQELPMYTGYTVGHWEGAGDTAVLVMETKNLRPGQYDRSGAPFTDQLRVLERMQKIDPETIRDDVTLDDPVALTKPWHVIRYFKKQHYPYARLIDWSCEDNNNFVEGGPDGTDLRLPGEAGYKDPNTYGKFPDTAK
jgi:hypothetical protein